MLEELLFFCDLKEYPSKTIEDFGNNKLTLAILLKRTGDHLSGNIDDIVLQMVYGNSRKPPGDEKSPAFKLKKVWNESGKLLDWVDAVKNLSEDELRQLDDRVLLGWFLLIYYFCNCRDLFFRNMDTIKLFREGHGVEIAVSRFVRSVPIASRR